MKIVVSTHSRPKAAAPVRFSIAITKRSFNTQPPEGGWIVSLRFNLNTEVSTHSRPKAAAEQPLQVHQ